MKNLNRRELRRLIRESINELTLVRSGNEKVVELSMSNAFYLRHPQLEGGEIMVDEMDEVAGALVALKGMGFTHVHSLESGEKQSIGMAIQYFDNPAEPRYEDHYPDRHGFESIPYDTLIDDDDDDFI